MSLRTLMLLALVATSISPLSGCATAVIAGAAAAGGYIAYQEGYRVQSPVTKDRNSDSTR
jgi:Protein of unknown function (DUF3568)